MSNVIGNKKKVTVKTIEEQIPISISQYDYEQFKQFMQNNNIDYISLVRIVAKYGFSCAGSGKHDEGCAEFIRTSLFLITSNGLRDETKRIMRNALDSDPTFIPDYK
jgi:hypothetical protein